MITELVVRDLGVFADARLVVGPGLTALTGETGAGKSLVVGAIQLLLGARADASVVRPGASEATIDGRFVSDDGEEVVLTRVVPAEGRSRAYVNGRPVTAAELGEHGTALVELHGQHAHQQLLRADTQRHALDRFAGVDLQPLRELRTELARIDLALSELGGDERMRAREMDLLRYQLTELDDAAVEDPDEDDRLDEEEDVLGDAVAHREVGSAATDSLVGDDGVVDRLQNVIAAVSGRSPFAETESRLRSAAEELSETAHDLRGTAETIADDPERLAAIRERRQVLADLRRKYGESMAEVIEERERIRDRLDELERHDERASQLTEERAQVEARTAAAAAVKSGAKRA